MSWLFHSRNETWTDTPLRFVMNSSLVLRTFFIHNSDQCTSLPQNTLYPTLPSLTEDILIGLLPL